MPYAITKLKTLDLTGTSAEYDFDTGAHAASRTVYVVRARNGSVKLRAYRLEADGAFTAIGSERTVGSGSRTRIAVFSNWRIVVLWLDTSGALQARGYTGGANGSLYESDGSTTVETTITHFDMAAVGVTTGVQTPNPDGFVYYAYRHFTFTTLSANGGWKLWLGTVHDSGEISLGQVALGGQGDKVSVTCTPVNELVNGTHPRKVLTLCRDQGQIKTRTWRVSGSGVAALASAAESKALGVGSIHGMSIAQNDDLFATLVWPGASNSTARLQLLSVTQSGAMTAYGTAEIAQFRVAFARLKHRGAYAAVAYEQGDGKLTVAAWRFRQPTGSGSVRTVLASAVGPELPTQTRLTTLMGDYETDPVDYVTLIRVASGKLILGSWRCVSTLMAQPAGRRQGTGQGSRAYDG